MNRNVLRTVCEKDCYRNGRENISRIDDGISRGLLMFKDDPVFLMKNVV